MLSLRVLQISMKHRTQWRSWKLEPRLPAEPTELLVHQKIHLTEIRAELMPQLTEMYHAHHL